ncbi:hypothetical protein V8B55DRAFT_1320527 [Mucor lusitanicus]|uniref:F-box domain-containing protein n=2 Tax=Mucor circinelloides f. lusitanicus TaxID=29924 RepID=A0A168KP10_MUCCL|nr:hypothetical protein FB192DRAFT_1465138 [Mucor lusitanicus]OAD02606.1 hypothetical protein MUCCIDRAFT_111996 [Mucor lusitanicus CBS 277.49]
MWSCLPQELLVKIFGNIDSKPQLAECRLVCRFWHSQVDAILLAEHIILDSDHDVLQLYKFLNGNPARGSLVKHLTLRGSHYNEYLLSQLVHVVFSPTLEKFEGQLEGCGSDILLEINCKALDDTSGFDRLTVLPSPQEFTLMYFNTLLKFKQSLQSMALYLSDLDHSLEQQYIMTHVPGFAAVVVLDLKIKINDVTDVEEVLQHFDRLEQLTIELDTECAFIMSEKRLQEWTASSVTVVDSLDTLEVKGCFFGDVFEYLCYKYANVNSIKLDISEYLTPSLLIPAYNTMSREQITIQSKRISQQVISKISRAGIHLPETGPIQLECLALLQNDTAHLKYDEERKLITCIISLTEE